jgi:hypothetical protein
MATRGPAGVGAQLKNLTLRSCLWLRPTFNVGQPQRERPRQRRRVQVRTHGIMKAAHELAVTLSRQDVLLAIERGAERQHVADLG